MSDALHILVFWLAMGCGDARGAHRFVPDSMLAFSALRNTENGPPFVVWRDSVRLPSVRSSAQRVAFSAMSAASPGRQAPARYR